MSSPKIISHSLRSIPVEGEYCLSTNEHLIWGKATSETPAKIYTTFCFMELLLLSGPRIITTEVFFTSVRTTFIHFPQSLGVHARTRCWPCVKIVEIPIRPDSYNRSIPGQSSPLLTLDDSPGAALTPSMGGEPAFEEKGDKSYELDATSIKSPRGVSKSTISGACAGLAWHRPCAGQAHSSSFKKPKSLLQY
jgi:hypothetical protein